MAILPLQLARVSNLLRTSVATNQLPQLQQQLLETQNQLSTGQRLSSPSDDPGSAAIIMQLQKTLEQRQGYSDNLTQANSLMSATDSTLGDITDQIRQAQTLASANVGSDVTSDARAGAAAVVQSIYSQLISLANKQYQGMYLFGGDKGDTQPYIESNGGVTFVGSTTVLKNAVDQNTTLPLTISGNDVFGALSTRIQGTADLSPAMTAATRLVDLKGSVQTGVHPGIITLGNGSTTATVDLTRADSVGDVMNAINAAGVGGITASIGGPDGQHLVLSGGATDNITVNDVGGGTLASDLGIAQPVGAGAGVTLAGGNVHPGFNLLTPLSDLRAGAGLDTTGLTITNGLNTQTISFASATTVQDMLNAINGAGLGVTAKINATGTGIDVLNATQGAQMTIAEAGGATATQLGIRSFNASTPLSELNDGKGIQTADGPDFRISLRDGTSFDVDLTNENTIQDVINTINTAAGATVAGLDTTGNGIRLTDPSVTGTDTFRVTGLNYSTAAADLGLDEDASGNTIAGRDVNPVAASGIFAHLAQLRDALNANDQTAITAAGGSLQDDLSRVIQTHGQTGANVQEVQARQDRLADENVATHSLLSQLADTDFTGTVTKFQTLQNALQATLQTSAMTMNLSLLDFLQ
jgi:flagellin-like hook-associated protein FlgL